jgi:hypothetical protein
MVTRNPLTYPAGVRPGFNSRHIALASGGQCYLSAVPIGNTFIQLLNGRKGTIAGVPTAAIDGIIGPAVLYTVSTMNCQITGNPTTTPVNFTIAMIFRPSSVTGSSPLCATSGTSAGYTVRLSGAQPIVSDNVSGALSSSGSLTANVPYFLIISAAGATGLFVWTNLSTGQITSNTATSSLAAAASNGSYYIGYDFGNTPHSTIAAVAFMPGYLGLVRALTWARAPWSFWYPQPGAQYAGSIFVPPPFYSDATIPRDLRAVAY